MLDALPELPLEIWLRILLYCPDPKPLAQTHRGLHTLCLDPISSAKWLQYNYGNDSLLGALFYWCKSPEWRRWIRDLRANMVFPHSEPSPRFLSIKRAVKQYNQGWFSRKSKCKRCSATALQDSRLFDQGFQGLHSLRLMIYSNLMNDHCSFEHFQLRISMILVNEGATFDSSVIKLLIRYAASVGHSKLLNFYLSLASVDHQLFYSPSFATSPILADENVPAVFDLLIHSLESRQVREF
jgi:hypothetical protein